MLYDANKRRQRRCFDEIPINKMSLKSVQYASIMCKIRTYCTQKTLGAFPHNPEGSKPTAAGGGRKKASEWQRSIFSRRL